ncbi:hypothetical protein HMPREF9123_1908 [Neisseria bacilliformis ATCC BAA-1200]|uniref:Uncharacterized protein n=1 Tax=Neisseria bacilliformis ATCC BAA-1200 TaxID=888742 RepID=F2BDV2_9NEIS|nr:hypothetical protein HMPREF9123_1908 [Neisseria bacilliformis ATCC BAA-1200]
MKSKKGRLKTITQVFRRPCTLPNKQEKQPEKLFRLPFMFLGTGCVTPARPRSRCRL